MEYFYMPSMLIANIILLFVIAFPLVSWAVKKIGAPEQRMRRNMINFAGLVLLLSISAWTVLLVQSGLYKIAVSTVASDYESYSQFRPVRFGFKDLHYDCTPSNYWFNDGMTKR